MDAEYRREVPRSLTDKKTPSLHECISDVFVTSMLHRSHVSTALSGSN